jgi:hypothetical protein
MQAGAQVLENGTLVPAHQSHTFSGLASSVPVDLEHISHPMWEIATGALQTGRVLGEGEFGIVHEGRWNGTPVAVKVCMRAHVPSLVWVKLALLFCNERLCCRGSSLEFPFVRYGLKARCAPSCGVLPLKTVH